MTSINMPQGSAGQQPEIPASVFITGAKGFIGKLLMQRYTALGCDVRGMDIQADPECNVVAGDLARPETWANHAKNCELFINTAAVVSLSADWQLYIDVTVKGTRHALDVAIASGAKRFVQLSSIAAMGYDYVDGSNEKAPVVIGEDYRYGVAKGASEHVVLAAHAAGEIDCTIIRPGDVYGPGSRAWLIEPLNLAKSGQLILPNKGRGIFTPVYVDDLVDGVLLAAGLPEGAGHIFILWGGEPVTCAEFFSHHWRWAKRRNAPPSMPLSLALILTRSIWQLNKLFKRRNEISPDAMLMLLRQGSFNQDKAKKLLGFVPKVGLQEGIKRSEDWLRSMGQID